MRILLVEDDPTTARSIEMMLTHASYNVYRTDMGEEGIDLAKVTTDSHAPGEFRADAVRNLDAWYAAFAIAPGGRLYLAEPDRVRIW